jgi:hypothetical protein
MDLIGGVAVAFHRAFEMGHERRTFDGQIIVVFHDCSFALMISKARLVVERLAQALRVCREGKLVTLFSGRTLEPLNQNRAPDSRFDAFS